MSEPISHRDTATPAPPPPGRQNRKRKRPWILISVLIRLFLLVVELSRVRFYLDQTIERCRVRSGPLADRVLQLGPTVESLDDEPEVTVPGVDPTEKQIG